MTWGVFYTRWYCTMFFFADSTISITLKRRGNNYRFLDTICIIEIIFVCFLSIIISCYHTISFKILWMKVWVPIVRRSWRKIRPCTLQFYGNQDSNMYIPAYALWERNREGANIKKEEKKQEKTKIRPLCSRVQTAIKTLSLRHAKWHQRLIVVNSG